MTPDNDNHISHARLRAVLSYEPETGEFHWLVNKGNVKAGRLAGKRASNGYWRIKADGKDYPAHRLAWFYVNGRWPEGVIDHINRDPLDNRFCNLREASFAQNQYNRTEQRNNTSGFKGVSRFKKTGKWRAEIMLNGKSHYLGAYETAELASKAYDEAAISLHQSFARNAERMLAAANDNAPKVVRAA